METKRRKMSALTVVLIVIALVLALTLIVMTVVSLPDIMTEEEITMNATQPSTEPEPTQPEPTEPPQETVDDGKVAYKVIVVDESGAPIAGAMVQICEGTACNPGVTNAEGVAEIRAAEGNYEAKMLSMPAGYTYATEQEVFAYESGALEVTIVLKPAA